MRLVDCCIAEMRIAEDEKYSLHLVRRMDDGEFQPIQLYKVRVVCIDLAASKILHDDDIFILADSPEAAEGQASCVSTKGHATACNRGVQNFCHAERVKMFGIRGWSGNTF